MESSTEPNNINEQVLPKGLIHPVGVEGLPAIPKSLVVPYRSDYIDYITYTALLSEIPILASALIKRKNNGVKSSLSRREFLKYTAAGLLGSSYFALEHKYPGLLKETSNLTTSGALALQAPEIFNYQLNLELNAKPDYYERLKKHKYLPHTGKEQTDPEYQDQVIKITYSNPISGAPIDFYGYKINGTLVPVSPKGNDIAGRNDYYHEAYGSKFVAFFNATAPGNIEWAKSLRYDPKEVQRLTPEELKIIYGSSSLFIPNNIDQSSMVWKHAKNRLSVPNQVFTELTFRFGDNTHLGFGFTKNSSGRLIEQQELINIVNTRTIPKDCTNVVFHQFAYNPSITKMADREDELPFSKDYHRPLSVLLVDEMGRQYVVAGPPGFYLLKNDYDTVIADFAKAYGVRFNAAVCLDLGMAGGFTLRTSDKILKPNFKNIGGNSEINYSLTHTGSIALVEQV